MILELLPRRTTPVRKSYYRVSPGCGRWDVISLSDDFFEDNPSTLDVVWREFALGVYRLESALMVVLDVGRLLDIKSARD